MTRQEARAVVDSLCLPGHAHVPGENDRHEEGFLAPIIDMVPLRTLSDEAGVNIGWLYGLRLLRLGYYWEAHEVWEAVWMRAAPNSREKRFLQAMIHLANAALKRRMGRARAAERLEALADGAFAATFPPSNPSACMGMDRTRLDQLRKELSIHP